MPCSSTVIAPKNVRTAPPGSISPHCTSWGGDPAKGQPFIAISYQRTRTRWRSTWCVAHSEPSRYATDQKRASNVMGRMLVPVLGDEALLKFRERHGGAIEFRLQELDAALWQRVARPGSRGDGR